ncbi:MAG: hypothetical protein ACJ8FY_19010 [Gemmataceae bacterium]
MTIAFSCPECDKTFKVSDEMAGRKGKCNNCGATMLIPNKIGATAKPGSRKSTVDPDDDEDWQDDDEPAGKVRRRRDADDDYEVARSRSRDRDDEIEDENDYDDRPRRRKRRKKKAGNKTALWVALSSVGALLILGGTYFALAFALNIWPFSGGPGDAMKFMPDNCKMLMAVKWDDVEKSQIFQDLKKEHPEIDKALNPQGQNNFGALKKKVPESFLFGFNISPNSFGGSGAQNWTAVMTFKERVTDQDVLNSFEDKNSYKESKVGPYKVYEKSDHAISVVSGKMVAIGPIEELRKVLERNKKPDISEGLTAAMGRVNFSKGIAIAADFKGLSPASPKGPGGPALGAQNPMAGFQKAGEEIENAAVQVTVGADLAVECTLSCKTSKGAEEIKKSVEGLSAMLGFFGGAVPKEAKEILDTLKVNVSGTTVTANLTIKGAAIASLAKNPMMAGGFGGPQAGGPPGRAFNPPAPGGGIPGGGGFPGGRATPGGPGGIKPPPIPGGNRPPRGGGPRPPNSP